MIRAFVAFAVVSPADLCFYLCLHLMSVVWMMSYSMMTPKMTVMGLNVMILVDQKKTMTKID